MNVHWTETAELQLDAIYRYIAHNSETYALHTVDRITRKSQQIGSHPLSGRKVPEYGVEQIREVFSGPYRVIYHIKSDQVDVIAVIHGAMNIVNNEHE